jgi:hypothetical protein
VGVAWCGRRGVCGGEVGAWFDCGWSLLNHGMADIKRLNLGNLNPIYETRGRSDHIFIQETIKT